MLRLRLQRLPATASAVLAVAAVRGTIDPQLITTVSEVATADVFGALDAALTAGLLTERDRRYRIPPRARTGTIYRDLPVEERVRLHAAVAEAFADELSVDPEIRPSWRTTTGWPRHSIPATPSKPFDIFGRRYVADIRFMATSNQLGSGSGRRRHTLTGAADPLDRCRYSSRRAAAEIRISAFASARDHVGEAIGIARDARRSDLVGEAAFADRRRRCVRWRTIASPTTRSSRL